MMNVIHPAKSCILKVWQQDDGIYLKQEESLIRICPQTETAIRISYTDQEEFCQEQGKEYKKPQKDLLWNWLDRQNETIVATERVSISVDKATGSVCYMNGAGTVLGKERTKESRMMEKFDIYETVENENLEVKEIVTADGVKRKISGGDKAFSRCAYRTRTYFDFAPEEIILGLGQNENGDWNFRNTTQYIHQANRKIGIPMLVSSKGYGILLSTQSAALFTENRADAYLQTEALGYLDYYFLGGFDMLQIIRDYRQITGKAAMLPKWAYGYIQSQERYESEEEILAIADEFQRRDIGVDCLVLDWMSWPDGQWGQKTFDSNRFPDPSGMIETLHKKGIHFMLSIWPNMSSITADYKEFAEKKLLFPGTEIYNAFKEEGRELYWKQVEKKLACHGIDGWWADSSEPITPEWEHTIEPEAGQAYSEYVHDTFAVMPPEKVNAFGMYHAQTIWEGQCDSFPEKRVVNLTRSGWAGSQRYGTIMWSGDIAASWECLKNQVCAGLQYAASGMLYWTLDIGAFFVKKGRQWYWNGEFDKGMEDPAYRELYIRWMEYAAFLPVFRAHGTDVRREPWALGKTGTTFYEAAEVCIKGRYRLLPYLYSQAAMACKNDGMLMRPLIFDFSEDKTVGSISDQYMLGDSLLVCPIVNPGGKRLVYLPTGGDWYDWNTSKFYTGGQWIEVEVPLEQIPVFVRAGSVIPTQEPGANTADMKDRDIILQIYPGCDGHGVLYEDAEDGYGYEKGDYCITDLFWKEKTQVISWKSLGNQQYRLGKLKYINMKGEHVK